jgi:myosin heavy subunit
LPQTIPKLYGPETIATYRHQTLGKLAPHVYAIAEEAYQRMRREDYNQSVLVSGESGAGKTETTKILLEFLASVSVESHKKVHMQLHACRSDTAPHQLNAEY